MIYEIYYFIDFNFYNHFNRYTYISSKYGSTKCFIPHNKRPAFSAKRHELVDLWLLARARYENDMQYVLQNIVHFQWVVEFC